MQESAPSSDQITPPASAAPARITLRDILYAIFVPEADDEGTPAHHPEETEGNAAPGESILPEIDNSPTLVSYPTIATSPVERASFSRILTFTIGAITSLLLVYLAGSVGPDAPDTPLRVILFGLAMLAWTGVLVLEIAPPDGALLRRGPSTSGGGAARQLASLELASALPRILMGISALALSVITYILSANNTFTLPGVTAWALSIILWMLALAERTPEELLDCAEKWLNSLRPKASLMAVNPGIIGLMLVILAAATFFRFYRLDVIPPEMTSDHVEKLLDVNRILNGTTDIFMRSNAGRESLHFYLLALESLLFGTGISFTTLKLGSIIEGLLLIPLIVVLAREVIDQETGFIAAALLAVSWWHVMLSRLGLRIVLTPLIMTLILIVLIRGIRTGERKAWLWAGFWMGIGVYSYQALRMTPLVALAAYLVAIVRPLFSAVRASLRAQVAARRQQEIALNTVSRQSLNLVAAGIIALAFFAPMLRVWHDYPADLWNRVINRTTENEVTYQSSPGEVFTDNYRRALGMWNIEGDASWFISVPGVPMLDVITGGLFVLGVTAWALRLWTRRDPVDGFVILAILIMLLPSALALAFPIENPSTTRGSGTLPLVFVLAAWPLSLIVQQDTPPGQPQQRTDSGRGTCSRPDRPCSVQ